MNRVLKWLRTYTHKKRYYLFFKFIKNLDRPINMIDLGGTVSFWNNWGITELDGLNITLVNNHHIDKTNVGYDNSLPFIKEIIRDVNEITVSELKKYDLIFSNSFIEHLDSSQRQKLLGLKIEKSQRPYFIQVPNKNFLIDPHFPHPLVPFFALYPKRLQGRLLTLNRFGSGSKSHSFEEALRRLAFYTPMSLKDLKIIFPLGKVRKEGFFSSPSLIAAKD